MTLKLDGTGAITGIDQGLNVTGIVTASSIIIPDISTGVTPGTEIKIWPGNKVYSGSTTNIAIGGTGTLMLNTQGNSNVAIGNESMVHNTSGDDNVCIGYAAGSNITTSDKNVAVGAYAIGYWGTYTGNYNTAVGCESLLSLTTGDDNTAVGRNAGDGIAEGDDNVAIGAWSLRDCYSGNGNIAIGYRAGKGIDGSNNIIIGNNNAQNTLPDDLSSTVIVSCGVTERLRINSAGDVGIGTTDPKAKLHVENTSGTATRAIISQQKSYGVGTGTAERAGLDLAIRESNVTSDNRVFARIETGTESESSSNNSFLSVSIRSGGSIEERLRITSDGHVGINSTIPGSLVDIMGQTSEDAIVNIGSYDKTSAIKLWPSNDHDKDRWRMAFWEDNAVSDGNDYPDWMVDGYGRTYQNNNFYIGRSRSFSNSPVNRYNYYGSTGPGILIYNGVDGDDTNYSAYLKLVCYQNDDDDRNIIYYTHTDTTATVDYDAHQTFGVTGSGRVQGMHHFWSGRVESDEGSPNSVYVGSTNNGYFSYHSSGFSAYMRSRNTDNTEACFYLDTGGGPVFKVVSNGNGYFDGVADAGNADYAEYFEWADGNPNNEDRRGYPVIIVPNTNGKIGIATTGDDRSQIMGIVSANPGFVGDSASLNWQGRHLRDEWGSWVTEDQEFLVWNKKGTYFNENGEKVENPQPNINDPNCDPEHSVLVSEIATTPDIPQYALDNNLRITKPARVTNPDFDSSQIYTPRSDRQEWSAVGLMGKLWLRANQPTGDRWIKLKDGSNDLSYWLVR